MKRGLWEHQGVAEHGGVALETCLINENDLRFRFDNFACDITNSVQKPNCDWLKDFRSSGYESAVTRLVLSLGKRRWLSFRPSATKSGRPHGVMSASSWWAPTPVGLTPLSRDSRGAGPLR